jgi:alkyl hydroperoxide reductase subunit AhpF
MEQMLDEGIQGQVREFFNSLRGPVAVLFFGTRQPERCQYCAETRQLLEEVCALSDLLSFEAYDIDENAALAAKYRVDGAPGFVLLARDEGQEIDYGVRFKGIPAGHEFASLVNSLVFVSKRDSGLAEETRRFLSELVEPVHLQVFVTPT